MKNILFFILFTLDLFSEYSIIFVHIGNSIPNHTKTAIQQARLFNPDARIILLGNKISLADFLAFEISEDIELIDYEKIKLTPEHKMYQKNCKQNQPFWRYTSERFLYLWDLIEAYSLDNVFHLENDNMIYGNLKHFLSVFQKNYPGIGATFDNDDRCIAGFMWIANKDAMVNLARHFARLAPLGLNDMQVIGGYHKEFSNDKIDNLPIIMNEYVDDKTMISPHNHSTKHPYSYSKNSDLFESIFDAAAIGQYLGGIDPIHANNQPGFINESCLFNPSLLSYFWERDKKNRLIPYAIYKEKKYRIFNLHIHSKRLSQFQS